jgi:hypothetical protein
MSVTNNSAPSYIHTGQRFGLGTPIDVLRGSLAQVRTAPSWRRSWANFSPS